MIFCDGGKPTSRIIAMRAIVSQCEIMPFGYFKNVLSIYSYSSLIGVISYMVKLPLILSKNSLEVYTSPALFLPGSAKETTLFKIAALLDVFTIWQIIVISIGMGVIYKVGFQKSLSVVGTMFVIYAAVSIIF